MNHVLLSVFTCNYTCQSHTNYCGAGGLSGATRSLLKLLIYHTWSFPAGWERKRLQNKSTVNRPFGLLYAITSAKFMFSLDLIPPNKSSPLTLHFSKLSRGQEQDARNSRKRSPSPLLFHKLKKVLAKWNTNHGLESTALVFLYSWWIFKYDFSCTPRGCFIPVIS